MAQIRASGSGDGTAKDVSEWADSDVTQRQLIAEAACRVIARGGIGDATFRRIATELGATTGLISHYFASKVDLLNYTLNYAQERLLQQSGSFVWSSKEAFAWSSKEAFVDDLCRALTPTNEAAAIFWRVWVAYLGVAIVDDEVRAEYVAWDDISRRQLVSLVAGELGDTADAADAELAADAVNALASGIGILAMLEPERLTADRVRRILLSSFDGIVAAARETASPARRKANKRDRQ